MEGSHLRPTRAHEGDTPGGLGITHGGWMGAQSTAGCKCVSFPSPGVKLTFTYPALIVVAYDMSYCLAVSVPAC